MLQATLKAGNQHSLPASSPGRELRPKSVGENEKMNYPEHEGFTANSGTGSDKLTAGSGPKNGGLGGANEGSELEKAGQEKRFHVKRWSACAFWAWDVMHDTCVICRNAMMSLCESYVPQTTVPQ
ncbi:unnamed protein product [Protopolystoma xenopodis]|uniref:Anaphase-promoting complex subunit 11 RING-H2 finger domain-containing protein n=1 Tax=Protopolystoma xenopodis TaxID=117903 RepID=A0A3S5AV20_9PLAT|nr:unnamed protein product [Protopolystoma xenopodis]